MKFDVSQFTKITEDQFVRFINTTPEALTPTWVLLAAVEEGGAGIEYNPNIERVKLIVNKNASTNHKSNDKQMSVTYLAYKGDDCFEFVNAGRDKLNYKTDLLEVDLWDETSGSYSAKMSNATIGITTYHGDTIEFNVYADGDPEEGTVTITNQVPTFTPSTSL
jgi:hypothetical protein